MSLHHLTAAVIITALMMMMMMIPAGEGFNLDPRIPIIKSGGDLTESFFGYSVAQHRIVRNAGLDRTRVLVGAPRDQNLQPGTNRSGSLYQCTLSNDIDVSHTLF